MNTSSKGKKYLIIAILLVLITTGFFTLSLKAQWVVNNITIDTNKETVQEDIFKAFNEHGDVFSPIELPKDDPDRLDILVVGMRGSGEGFGDFLTDTILLLSIDQTTGQAAMVSIPRDLYITIPYNGKVKINEVYGMGLDKGDEKLAFSLIKTIASQVTGVHIDGLVRIDFEGFKKLVNIVGGVDVYLDKPFVEVAQWQGIGGFRLPAGNNHLNGDQALFYVRSRFSTSDFDRARRQQQLLLALKEKITGLGILSNPVKVYNILDVIGNHVKTDAGIDIPDAIALAQNIDYTRIHQLVLSTQNHLYSSTAPNGAYILLPKGNSYTQLHKAIQHIFVTPLPTTPASSSHERLNNSNNTLQNSSNASRTSEVSDE